MIDQKRAASTAIYAGHPAFEEPRSGSYICEPQPASDGAVWGCEHCEIACRRHCTVEHDADARPEGVGEPMVGAIE